jgi:tetratricopeptide (TPR) repeat protein
MVPLRKISPAAIPAALEKARCYRFLKEPAEAESICRDVLEIEPDNEAALITLLLALTDQFGRGLEPQFTEARRVLPRLKSEHGRRYYEGIVCERRAKAHLYRGGPGSGGLAYEWLQQALQHYERAIALELPGNDDAILRWNACARLLQRHSELKPGGETQPAEQMLE